MVALVLAVGAVWQAHSLYQREQNDAIAERAQLALERGDLVRAEVGTGELELVDSEHRALPGLRGRLALAQGDNQAASRHLLQAWERTLEQPADPIALALLGRDTVKALQATGSYGAATAINARALTELGDFIDQHLDRDDLGSNGLPLTGAGGDRASQASVAAIELVLQVGEVAAGFAEGLRNNGDGDRAQGVLEQAADRIVACTRTGTHRIICRGARVGA